MPPQNLTDLIVDNNNFNSTASIDASIKKSLVGQVGLEPTANCLRGNCSTNWATDPNLKHKKISILAINWQDQKNA